MADEYDGNTLARGVFPCQSASLSGLLRDCADIDGSAPFGSEEMGLLDSMALCEHCEPDALSEGGSGVHADCQLPLSCEWCMVAVHLV